MQLRLHEIERGTEDLLASRNFYTSVLGLPIALAQDRLAVLNAGVAGIDFNISAHLPPHTTLVSFLTDNLQHVMDILARHGVAFSGPEPSHLGTACIVFKDPDGNAVRVAQPSADSPAWLTV